MKGLNLAEVQYPKTAGPLKIFRHLGSEILKSQLIGPMNFRWATKVVILKSPACNRSKNAMFCAPVEYVEITLPDKGLT